MRDAVEAARASNSRAKNIASPLNRTHWRVMLQATVQDSDRAFDFSTSSGPHTGTTNLSAHAFRSDKSKHRYQVAMATLGRISRVCPKNTNTLGAGHSF